MRLFVSISPPQECNGRIEAAAAPLKDALGVKVLPPDNWHITLAFIGDVPEAKAQDAIRALSSVSFAPFKVWLSGAGAFPDIRFPRAIWIGGESSGCAALAIEVCSALEKAGIAVDRKKFSIHLTVARSKSAGDIDDFLKKTKEVCEFEARSFYLMESRLLPHGASYRVVKEFQTRL
jgi:2'-5' RNA ligase